MNLPKGIPLGCYPLERKAFKAASFKLSRGAALIVYTDGVTEANDANERLFEESRLYDVVSALPDGATCQCAVEAIRGAVADFAKDQPQADDITVLAFKYLA
jgi:sigma-B regulation protein RsbU (phosphoserine phosphatase)